MLTQDPASIIKSSVTMEDVLRQYGFHPGRKHRIPCPLHNGKDDNFSYNDTGYKCFVCGKSGSVIDFVMELYGIGFRQAVVRLGNDFHLNLGLHEKNPHEISAIAEARRKEREQREREEEETKRLLAEHRYWWEVLQVFSPATFDGDYVHPLYAEAIKELTVLAYKLDARLEVKK